jgi:ribonuclease-3
VLGCAVAAELYARFPRLSEGKLTRLRASLGLASELKLGEGEQAASAEPRPSILADALEALFGAVFLDAGYDAARSLMLAALGERLDRLDPERPGKDAKTELQEVLQAAHRPLPLYRVVAVQGAAHRQSFEVECVVDELVATGSGASRQKAEQGAARAMLEKLTA